MVEEAKCCVEVREGLVVLPLHLQQHHVNISIKHNIIIFLAQTLSAPLDLCKADPGEGDIVLDRRVGDRLKNLLVHIAHMGGLLPQLQTDAQVRCALLVQAQLCLLKEALSCLAAH